MPNSTAPLTPELQAALDGLVPQWVQAQITPDLQRQTFSELETLLCQAAQQMDEEGQLTPDGPAYTPELQNTVLKLHLTALNAMVLKAHEERLPAEALTPLLSHGAARSLEQARYVVKSHLDAGHSPAESISADEIKGFLTEAAVYAMSYTIERYRQQKSSQTAQNLSSEQAIHETHFPEIPRTESSYPTDDGVFLKKIIILLIGIGLLLFTADRVTASGMDGPMTLMVLMFGISASFGYYFYQVLQRQQREIQVLKNKLPDEPNEAKALPTLGVPALEIQLGRGLDMLQATVMLPMELTLFRTKMAEELGLQLAEIPLNLNPTLGDSKYRILLRGDVMAQGQVFPPRLMVTDQQLEHAHLSPPENSIAALDEASAEDVHWVPSDWSALGQVPGKPKSASRVILKHLEFLIFTHMDEIIGQTEMLATLDRVRELSPGLPDRLVPRVLGEGPLRRIWVNLLREHVPVKDVTFLFERLIELTPISREPDALSEQLRLAMSRKLCQMHTDVSGVMYVLVLSESWERRLIDSFNEPRWSTPFGLTPDQMESLAETTVSRMTYAETTYHCRPVLLCAPAIRMAMFLFLSHYIPGIIVLGHNELVPDTQIEVVGTIDA